MVFVPKYEEEMKQARNEIAMWRRREIDNMLFTDTPEEKWFTEMLMNRPIGIENIDEFADFMLKGYRKTREEIK
jgi:hypothetical protein